MSCVENRASRRPRRRGVAVFVIFALVVIASPVVIPGLAIWAAGGTYEFSGGGFRHWLFVKGTTIERLGFVAKSAGPVSYVVRLGDGTDLGSMFAVYESAAAPEIIGGNYAERCRALGIPVMKYSVTADARKIRLVCQGDSATFSDDVLVIAVRSEVASKTAVRVVTGPGLTLTYSFD